MNNSIWLDNIKLNKYKKLEKDIEVDILIIGGGITGLVTSYYLINKNKTTALVEKNSLFHGITSKTTGKLTYLQENIYSKLKQNYNENISKLYLSSQIEAINNAIDIISKNNIDCDLEKVKSYIFTNENKNINKIKKEEALLKKYNKKTSKSYKLPDNTKIKYGISVSDTYVFNPLKYLNSLSKICYDNGINIYENTKIEKIIKEDNYFKCISEEKTIKAKQVVLALHYPYFLKPLFMPLKTTLEKSYIKAIKVDKKLPFSAINIDNDKLSIRYCNNKNNNYKLILTNSHNIAFKNNEIKNFNNLKEYNWSNIDIMTNDYLPYIGSVYNNLYISTGYNAWGMTNSHIGAKIISDLIQNKSNKYTKIFNPNRFNKFNIINFPISLFSNTKSIIENKIIKNKSWYKNVYFKKINGKEVGIYLDELGKKHIVYNKCPHLKCGLIFNEIEKTWDCPCHGSRFDIDGFSIEGPSNYNITYNE